METKIETEYFKVQLVAKTGVENLQAILAQEGQEFEGELTIENLLVYIARVSSSRINKAEKPYKLIKYLMDNKHWSPFDLVNVVIEVVTSKAIAIQFLRHSSIKPQEFSQRYSKVERLIPIEIRQQAETNRQSSTEVFDPMISFIGPTGEAFTMLASEAIDIATGLSMSIYDALLEARVAKECARGILPMCSETKLYFNGTLRSWLAFLNVRLDEHAQKEARDISNGIAKIIQNEFPLTTKATNEFNDFQGMFM